MIWTTRPRSDLGHGLTGYSEGHGAPLILIHGVGLRAEAWAAMMPLLAPHFAVTALDMPGHGGSVPVSEARLEAYVDAIRPLADDLAARHGRVYVAGHSMGAMIALSLAGRPDCPIAGLAALNAVYRRPQAAAAAVRARADALASGVTTDPEPTLARWFDDTASPPAVACRDWLTHVPMAGYAMAYRTFAYADGPSDGVLAGLTCPALFATGEGDPNSTPDMSRAMAENAPNGCSLVVNGAAHMAPMTHPAPIVAAIVDAFRPNP